MFPKTFQMRIAGTRCIKVICTGRHKTTCSKPHKYRIVQKNSYLHCDSVVLLTAPVQQRTVMSWVHCLLMGLLKRPHKYPQRLEAEKIDCTWRADKKPGSPGLKAAGVTSSTGPNIGKSCADY